MLDFMDFAVFVGMLLLRFGVPALVIVAIGYGLKRLDARWEAEARAYQAKVAAEQPAVQPEAPQPVAPQPARRPGKQPVTPQPLPFIPPQPATREQRPGMYAQAGVVTAPGMKAAGKQGWEEKKCSEAVQAAYGVSGNPDIPCWQARLKAEGQVPEDCVTCDIFQRYPSM